MKYHIITVGGYGYNDVGDESMPKNILINMRELFGKENLDVTMLSPDPEFTEKFHGYRAIADMQFSRYRLSIEQFNQERDEILERAREYIKSPGDFFDVPHGSLDRKKFSLPLLLQTLNKADALLNVGGGNINSLMRCELYKKTTLYELCAMLGIPVFISGQTIGPFYEDNDRKIACQGLQKAEILTFRDFEISRKRVKEIGLSENSDIKMPIMYDAGDDALSLPQITKEQALDIIKNELPTDFLNSECSTLWALNLKQSLSSFKNAEGEVGLANEISLMAEITDYIIKHFPESKILFVPTDYCKGTDDRTCHRQIYDLLDSDVKKRTCMLENIYNDLQLKGIISICDFALGARYHFNVFSLAANVPSIGIASGEYQRTKLNGIFSLLDIKEFYYDHDMSEASLNGIAKKIYTLVQQKAAIKKKLDRNVPELVEKSKRIVKLIHKYLQG